MIQHRAQESSRARQGFTLIELLVVIAIISIIAGFLVPTLLRGRGEAYKAQCLNNLKQLYTLALGYSQKKGNNAYPIGDGKEPAAHESLNKLVDYEDDLNPKLFICPEGEASAAEKDSSSGKFTLSAETLSYSWVKKRMKSTTPNKALSSDKYIQGFEDGTDTHQGHQKGMVVLMTDGSVSFVEESDPMLSTEDKIPDGLTR